MARNGDNGKKLCPLNGFKDCKGEACGFFTERGICAVSLMGNEMYALVDVAQVMAGITDGENIDKAKEGGVQ